MTEDFSAIIFHHRSIKLIDLPTEYLQLVARNDSLFSSKIISGNQLEILSWEIKRLDTSVMQNNSREIVRLVFCPENIL